MEFLVESVFGMNSGGVARIDVVAPIMGEFFLSCVLFRSCFAMCLGKG